MPKPKNPKDQPPLFPAPARAAEPSSAVPAQTALIGLWQAEEGKHGLGKGKDYSRHAMVLAELYRRCDGRLDRAETAIRLFFDDEFAKGGSLNPAIGRFQRDLLRYAVRADRLLTAQAVRRSDSAGEAAQAITAEQAAAVERRAPPEAREAIERLKRSIRATPPP